MGLLSLDRKEQPLQEIYIAESARLLGTPAQLYQVSELTEDLYSDPKVEYKSPVNINILFDDQPKVRLKKLGWLTENDANPYLAIITNYSDNIPLINSIEDCTVNTDKILTRIEVQRYSKVTVTNYTKVESEDAPSTFLVTEVRGNSINPLYWECKLVPYRPKIDLNPRTDEIERTIDGKPANTIGRSYISKEI